MATELVATELVATELVATEPVVTELVAKELSELSAMPMGLQPVLEEPAGALVRAAAMELTAAMAAPAEGMDESPPCCPDDAK